MPHRVFISHIAEEATIAARLKGALERDFLDLVDVFVSSDGESIEAGEMWLTSIEAALAESSMLLILCSRQSVMRPWINFEAGAAWMRRIPLVPICHAGLLPNELPAPLSLRQGLVLSDPEGLRRLYSRVAGVLQCRVPARAFEELAREVAGDVTQQPTGSRRGAESADDAAIRTRLEEALHHPRFDWRTLSRVATEAAVSEEAAARILRTYSDVRFSRNKRNEIIVGLRSRVGSG
jgi:hypothetical protein